MKVYSLKDRITVDIDGVSFKLAPLSYKQKIEIQNMLTTGQESEGTIKAVQYSLKDVEGLTDSNDNEYELRFDDNGLTEDCLDEILNIETSMKLVTTCVTFINGIPKQIITPDGKPLEGVKIVNPKQGKKKKTSR